MNVISQISTRLRENRLVLFAGSGLVQDAGLPSWPGLIQGITQDLMRSSDLDKETAEFILARAQTASSLPMAADLLFSVAPRRRVIAAARTMLSSGGASAVVSAAASVRFRGLVTTNYDRVTEGVVPPQTVYRLTNSEAALTTAPAAVTSNSPFLLKLHGDLDDELDPSDPRVSRGGPFMVLSKGDFAVLLQGRRGEQIVLTLHTILQANSILFLGYSFSDPDVLQLLNYLNETQTVAHPSWFVTRQGETPPRGLPSNVEFVPELASWSALAPWLEELAKLARTGPAPVPSRRSVLPALDHSLYVAIGTYLHDLETSDVVERVLASAFVDCLAGLPTITASDLASRIRGMLGVGTALSLALADATLAYMATRGLVRNSSDASTYQVVQEEAKRLRDRAGAQRTKDREAFFRSLSARLPQDQSVNDLDEMLEEFDRILIDIASRYGESLARWVSLGLGDDDTWPEIEARIVTNPLDGDQARRTGQLLRLVLTKPTDSEIPYLYRVLGAAFLANSARLSPLLASTFRESLSLYELYLDANVLLPLLVKEHPDHAATVAVFQETRSAGVDLHATQAIFSEVSAHREVARRAFEEMGSSIRNIQELAGALGYRTNVYVRGYLEWLLGRRDRSVPWREYLAKYSDAELRRLAQEAGVSIVTDDATVDKDPLYAEALSDIRQEWLMKLGFQRDEILNEHEAELLTYIVRKRETDTQRGGRIWFISYETVLVRVYARRPSKWQLPVTFPYSAWAAFIDSRLPWESKDPGAIVRAILNSQPQMFDLPTPVELVRNRAFGPGRVTSADEEAALGFAMSDHGIVTRVEESQRALVSRARRYSAVNALDSAESKAVGEVSGALTKEIRHLRTELNAARTRIKELEKPNPPQLPAGRQDRRKR